MNRAKNKIKLKKRKIKLSTVLGRLYYINLCLIAFVLTIILLCHFKFDFKNITLLILLALFSLPAFAKFGHWLVLFFWHLKYINSIKFSQKTNSSQARGGAPGSGKSSSMYHDGIIMAQMSWREICYKVFLIKCHIFKTKKTRSQEWDDRAIMETYNFYKSHKQFIPCLFSKYTVTDRQGRISQKLTLDHLQAKRKLLYGSVLLYDEIGQDLPAMLKFIDDVNKDVDLKKVADFMRYLRHYGNFKIIFTEQDPKNMFIGNRRVTDLNRKFIKQEPAMQPKYLIYIKYFLHWLFANIQLRQPKWLTVTLSKLLGKFLIGFDNFVANIGYRKYTFIDCGNTDYSLVGDKKGVFYLTPSLNCSYDDRVNKFNYDAVNNDYNADNSYLNEVQDVNEEVYFNFVE